MTGSGGSGDFVTLARVVKTQGRHGEVGIESHSDKPGRFHEDLRLFALAEDGSRRELHVEEVWPHKGLLILKFSGIDSISDAETLIGSELQVPDSERAQLESGWTYVSDLVGSTVFDGNCEIGRISDVRFGAGEAPLLVVQAESREYEIPFADAYLRSTDLEHRQVRMQLPEGMLEVNAPLTAEEKEQQKRSR